MYLATAAQEGMGSLEFAFSTHGAIDKSSLSPKADNSVLSNTCLNTSTLSRAATIRLRSFPLFSSTSSRANLL